MLDGITKAIGVFVLSIIIIAIPILCGLSFGLGWADEIKFLFVLCTFIEWSGVVLNIA